jgi:lactate dehydrogenase-like 2-hydroxyacid dehydrogenase
MKPTAFFINTSRGGTYKESDLARALVNGGAWPKNCERFQKILGFKPVPLQE